MPFEMDSTISIHAPREGGDCFYPATMGKKSHFNPRPPRGGRPALLSSLVSRPANFNPRPPRGGRPMLASRGRRGWGISIHAKGN